MRPLESLRDIPGAENAFLVGGSVRDSLLGRRPQDYDIAVFPPARRFAEAICRKIGGHWFPLGKPGQEVLRVLSEGIPLDISPVNGPTIESDLRKRDFTVNAMACRLSSGETIDCTGGMADLRSKTIRMVSPRSLAADPIRLLRAYRLAAQLGFGIDPRTAAAVADRAPMICTSAGERIHTELFKLLAVDPAFPWVTQMARDRLLFSILPELSPLRGCRQGRHHALDAWAHTLSAFEEMEKILIESGSLQGPGAGRLERLAGETPALLKLAVLLHDIGKPETRRSAPGRTVTFHGHAEKGAEMAQAAAERLRCSAGETRTLEGIIRRHLQPLQLFISCRQHGKSRRRVTRFFMKNGPLSPLILLHALADHRGKQRGNAPRDDDFSRFIQQLLDDYFTDFIQEKARPALITGHDLISELGLKPGPEFKAILNRVEEARLSGEAATRSEGLRIAADHVSALGMGPRNG